MHNYLILPYQVLKGRDRVLDYTHMQSLEIDVHYYYSNYNALHHRFST